MKKRIPFVPFPLPLARKISRPFLGVGERLSKILPNFDVTLDQAEMNISSREYLAVAFFSFWFWTLIILSISFLFFSFLNLQVNYILTASITSLSIGFLSFIYIVLYPQLIISRKRKELEKNLLFALRHLLIQVKSGVPLFDGLVSVSKGDYGLISKEFKKCTERISTGTSETAALEEMVFKNPSLHFRRVIWQITNALRSGADLGNTLDAIVYNLSEEQKVAIRKYGSQLNPLAMLYMLLGVIVPSLGITFLILLSSFSGFLITDTLLYGLLGFLALFQFFFMGIIKNRRPAIEL